MSLTFPSECSHPPLLFSWFPEYVSPQIPRWRGSLFPGWFGRGLPGGRDQIQAGATQGSHLPTPHPSPCRPRKMGQGQRQRPGQDRAPSLSPFSSSRLPYHPTFFRDTPYFLYFSIRVKYTEHETNHWNYFCIQFSGIQHINTMVQPTPPSLSRTFLSSHTQNLPLPQPPNSTSCFSGCDCCRDLT